MLHLPRLVLGTIIQEVLNPLPARRRDERLVIALVGNAVPVEVAHVQALSQDLVNDAAAEAGSA